MGVHGLWELLAPVGRRVSVETLAGKRLAIDASIWIIQFMKAMRDERGEMVRNAHILGFFRRICKLLYLRTKPVFVFDGGTPALKRRTVIARRRQRENAQAKIRKTAEKLLLNQLKTMRLKELAADLEKQRQENDIKGKRPIIQEPSNEQVTKKGNDDVAVNYNQEELDEMLAASLAAEENEGFNVTASTSGSGLPNDEVFRGGEDDNADDDDDDDDEEMILPEMHHGKVDPAVLAALPPSMQLDLLVQMRERLMAENRQKYQKVKKAPARFSQLQIEAYLKTVAFRREIDGVQKSAAGRGIGGMQTSRIASEANREFIFSSSFTGDKQALTSVGPEGSGADQSQPPPVNCSTNGVNKVSPVKKSGAAAGPTVAETGMAFHDDIETYVDERGRLRVSRVRALGIRMTRDLQRNLDLMKEIDWEKANTDQEKINESTTAKNPIDVLDNSAGRFQDQEVVDKDNDEMNDEVDKTSKPAVVNGNSIEISFEDSLENEYGNDDDDKLFACLVAGDPLMDFSVDNYASLKQSSLDSTDCEWEEGIIEDKSTLYPYERGAMSDEGEAEWEEGFQDIKMKSSSCPDESQKTVTKGAQEEEADFQEAIRRSLEATRDGRLVYDYHEDDISKRTREMVSKDDDSVSVNECKEGLEVEGTTTEVSQPFGSMRAPEEANSVAFIELNPGNRNSDMKNLNKVADEEADFQEAIRRSLEDTRDGGSVNDSHEDEITKRAREMVSEDDDFVSVNECKEGLKVEGTTTDVSQPFGSTRALESKYSEAKSAAFIDKDACGSGALDGEILVASDALPDEKGPCVSGKQPFGSCSEDGNGHGVNKQAAVDDHSCNTVKSGKVSADDSITDIDGTEEFAKEEIRGNLSMEKQEVTRDQSFIDDSKEHDIMEDHLEEEMLLLDEEREKLGSEQRKLERNAESVSSEMFAECQELLQMFGLPYIIAPMEAEAQCAFMELANLVDGVVTDDSDAFLFGARSVYKNIFDDRKYVETYLMKDIENELGLDREKIVLMALLLGSDYTEGISGIGIVNAIEVVNAFPGKDGLREFREWIESPDPTILGKFDIEAGSNSRGKGSKGRENSASGSTSNLEGISCGQNVLQPVDDAERIKQIFVDKHRNVSKNWHVSSSFPSDAVISAYISPQVDNSTESFSWGKPDLFVLRKLCWEKFGWGSSKADELLLPVLKEYNKHETQLRMEAFYTFNERFAKIRSKRINKAVKGITGCKSSDLVNETTPQHSESGKKRKVKLREEEASKSGEVDGVGTSTSNTMEKPAVKPSKRGRAKEKTSERNLEQTSSVDGHVIIKNESHARGRGRGRGRGRRQLSGRGRKKKNSCSADTENSYGDGSTSESDEEMQFDKSGESLKIRRSGRLRKAVNYTVLDEVCNSDKESEDNSPKEGSPVKDSFMDQAVGRINETVDNEPSKETYVETGGKLLVDETEQTQRIDKMSTSIVDDSQMHYPSNESQLQEDYLQFGGGFCLDEDKEMGLNDHASSLTRETVPEKSTNVLDGADSLLEESETPSYDHFPNSLRAMPNLRRKKRKT